MSLIVYFCVGHSDHMVQTGPITAHLYHVISCGESQLITIVHTGRSHSEKNDNL
ncbi:unnamed protein product, partial [Staurois parvus]